MLRCCFFGANISINLVGYPDVAVGALVRAIEGYLIAAFSSTGSTYFSAILIEFQAWVLRVGNM